MLRNSDIFYNRVVNTGRSVLCIGRDDYRSDELAIPMDGKAASYTLPAEHTHSIQEIVRTGIASPYRLLSAGTLIRHQGTYFAGRRPLERITSYQGFWTIGAGRCSERPSLTSRKELVEEAVIIVRDRLRNRRGALFLGDWGSERDQAIFEHVIAGISNRVFRNEPAYIYMGRLEPIEHPALTSIRIMDKDRGRQIDTVDHCMLLDHSQDGTLDLVVCKELLMDDEVEIEQVIFLEDHMDWTAEMVNPLTIMKWRKERIATHVLTTPVLTLEGLLEECLPAETSQ